MLVMEGWMDGRTDGRTDVRTENTHFIGPSGYAGGPKIKISQPLKRLLETYIF